MARGGRVQVGDLSAPDKLYVPDRLPSDTFEGGTRPPEDNNAEALASALGTFNRGLMAYDKVNKEQEAQALRQQQLADWETWKSARTSDEQLKLIRAGQAPYTADPFVKRVIESDGAKLEIGELSRNIDQEIKDGKVPFGTPNFDPERYVMEKAQSYVERLQSSPGTLLHFGEGLSHLRKAVTEQHQEKLGIVQTRRMEDVAVGNLGQALDDIVQKAWSGVPAPGTQAISGQDASDMLQEIYKALGPRVQGGSLDIKQDRMDQLLLGVLQEKAKDPRYAQLVMGILSADRKDASGVSRGSLRDEAHMHPVIDGIDRTATKALSTWYEGEVQRKVNHDDAAALARGDGSYFELSDISAKNPYDPGSPIQISRGDRQKAAVSNVLQSMRAANGGVPSYEAELEVLRKSNVPHPEVVSVVKGAFGGLATDQSLESRQAFIRAADFYNTVADKNYAYAEEHFGERVAKAFDMYTALVRDGGMDQTSAATAVQRRLAQGGPDISLSHEDREKIVRKVKNLGGSWWNPLSGGVTNANELIPKVVKLSQAFAAAEGVSTDQAVTMAVERLNKQSVNINGRAIFAAGIEPGDDKYVQPLLQGFFDKNKEYLQGQGVKDASYLSIAPYRANEFAVVRYDGMPVTNLLRKPDGTVEGGMSFIPLGLLQAERTKQTEIERKAVRDAIIGRRFYNEPEPANVGGSTPWARDGVPDSLKGLAAGAHVPQDEAALKWQNR